MSLNNSQIHQFTGVIALFGGTMYILLIIETYGSAKLSATTDDKNLLSYGRKTIKTKVYFANFIITKQIGHYRFFYFLRNICDFQSF